MKDYLGIFAICVFFTLIIIGLCGIMECLSMQNFWHIFTTIVISNGLLFTICMCAGEAERKANEDRRLGRRWVWDKFNVCDPDLCEGHYVYDNR